MVPKQVGNVDYEQKQSTELSSLTPKFVNCAIKKEFRRLCLLHLCVQSYWLCLISIGTVPHYYFHPS